MKRTFIVSLVFTLLLFKNTIVSAQESVVLNAIFSEGEEDHVFLLADQKEGPSYENFIVQVGFGGEQQYSFPKWRNSKYMPKLFHADINADDLKDIIVVLNKGGGTAVSLNEVHVLQQTLFGYKEIPVVPIRDIIDRLVRIEKQGDNILISIGEDKYVVDLKEIGYDPKSIQLPVMGQMEDYHVDNHTLVGTSVVFATAIGSVGYIQIKYSKDGKKYRPLIVQFIPDKPLKP